jgi:hypothetical protein
MDEITKERFFNKRLIKQKKMIVGNGLEQKIIKGMGDLELMENYKELIE